jgi:hypothetical protein
MAPPADRQARVRREDDETWRRAAVVMERVAALAGG